MSLHLVENICDGANVLMKLMNTIEDHIGAANIQDWKNEGDFVCAHITNPLILYVHCHGVECVIDMF